MIFRFRKATIVLLLIITLSLCLNTQVARANIYYIDTFDHWAEDTIYWASNQTKLFNGYEDGTFRPDNSISRSEFIAIIYRSAAEQGIIKPIDNTSRTNAIPQINYGDNLNNDKSISDQLVNDEIVKDTKEISELVYNDFNKNHWAYDEVKAVSTYVDNNGGNIKFADVFPGNNLKPSQYITREEAAVLSHLFMSPPIEEKSYEFIDVTMDYKYYNQINQLANNGIITGYGDNTFRPTANITRAEAATIIQRLYFDMEFLKRKYLQDIILIENSFLDKFPHFDNYIENEPEKDDIKYRKAVATLEYKSIVNYIPFEEQHLYDMNPINTLNELRDSNYHNMVGVNYYLIKYGNYDEEKNSELYNEILKEYIERDDLDDYESMVIFKEEFSSVDIDMLTKALEKWYNSTKDQNIKINIVFLLAKGYLANGNREDLLELVNIETDFDDVEVIKKVALNKAYVLVNLKDYIRAEAVLRKGWERVKEQESYYVYKNKYDKEFTGAIKEVILERGSFQDGFEEKKEQDTNSDVNI